MLLYGAIGGAFSVALLRILADSVFLHLEGQRLEADGDTINQNRFGVEQEPHLVKRGFLARLFGRTPKKTVFRSKLLQIHFQNVLRTFEQGSRRAWVAQDASLVEIQTLLTQHGMKLSWTLIEVLPQMGLVGTLVGLSTMFMGFSQGAAQPEMSVLGGFGTALGTTVLANLFVLILRPLHMQNERTVSEVLSTLQTLMAMFILPTQQSALTGHGDGPAPAFGPAPVHSSQVGGNGEARLARVLEDMVTALNGLNKLAEVGNTLTETAKVVQQVEKSLKLFQEGMGKAGVEQQRLMAHQLTESTRLLAQAVDRLQAGGAGGGRLEHDLTQLRVMGHDTLVLLDQVYAHIKGQPESGRMLVRDQAIRQQVFGEGHPKPGK